MRRLALVAALVALPLASCAGLQDKIAAAQARHRAYVCSHQGAVSAAANLALDNAARIHDETLRAAAIAAARAERDIVAACPAPEHAPAA
jgi:hypothetical protein